MTACARGGIGPSYLRRIHIRRVVRMLASTVPLLWRLTGLFLAAGVSNGIAGGGTFIAFPTLLAMGIGALQANVSVTVGVVPSFIGGIQGFRRELRVHRRLLATLVPACL